MFVPTAVAVPRYIIIVNSGMLNTIWAHVLPLAHACGAEPIKQFTDQIPTR